MHTIKQIVDTFTFLTFIIVLNIGYSVEIESVDAKRLVFDALIVTILFILLM